MLVRFPHCQYIDLFHESYNPGAYPPELYDARYTPKDAALAKQEDRLFELGVKAAKFIRAKFPQLKIIAGNSGGSAGMIAVLLRRGFPRELIDYLGSETTGQSFAPEKLSPHTTAGVWLMGETARKFGYDLPMSGCFEFTYRAERDLSPQRLAEWYTRDMLFGLANRFPTISPAEIEDVGNAYYDTLWGAAGLCQRRPLHYPKPAYVALATLTKVLDSVKLVRQMDTGSSMRRCAGVRAGQRPDLRSLDAARSVRNAVRVQRRYRRDERELLRPVSAFEDEGQPLGRAGEPGGELSCLPRGCGSGERGSSYL